MTGIILGTSVIRALLGESSSHDAPVSESLFDEWMLGDALEAAFGKTEPDAEGNAREALLVQYLVAGAFNSSPPGRVPISHWQPRADRRGMRITAVGRLLRLNEYRVLIS